MKSMDGKAQRATVMASLCEAGPAVPGAQKVMRPVNLVFVRAGGVRASVSSNLIFGVVGAEQPLKLSSEFEPTYVGCYEREAF